MAWLVRDGEVLATLETAATNRARARGLLGRDGCDGAMLLQPAKSVHTLGMRFAIDVAFVDRDMVVIRTVTMRRWRIGRPAWKAAAVIEAEAGTFAHWNLKVGDQLEIKG
ncbi:MAG TPA: DUF192 domain-containing protein [Acidimicrobiales bacterium]|jgi:hypothetical protein|nr:DUF192 domain-containing protein [Acidimicrobiales bacterium]